MSGWWCWLKKRQKGFELVNSSGADWNIQKPLPPQQHDHWEGGRCQQLRQGPLHHWKGLLMSTMSICPWGDQLTGNIALGTVGEAM